MPGPESAVSIVDTLHVFEGFRTGPSAKAPSSPSMVLAAEGLCLAMNGICSPTVDVPGPLPIFKRRSAMRRVFRGFTPRFLAVLLAVLSASTPFCAEAASKKGSFAFHYTSRLSDAELEWLKRFAIVVPGDILPSWQIEALHLAGSQIFFYEWATGIYFDDLPPLDPSSREAEWLLNPNEPDAGPDGYWHAYYYDPYPDTLKEARAEYVDGRRRDADYDGVFFDLVGSIYVPAYLQEAYTSRHPRTPYDTALSDFFKLLKQKGSLIFTNQGYRSAQDYLSISDYDLTESLFTSFVWGERLSIVVEGEGLVEREETFYRSWIDLRRIVGDIQSNVDRYNPSVRIFHLNYTCIGRSRTGRRFTTAMWAPSCGVTRAIRRVRQSSSLRMKSISPTSAKRWDRAMRSEVAWRCVTMRTGWSCSIRRRSAKQ